MDRPLSAHWRERYLAYKARFVVQQRRQHEYAINRYYAHLIDPFFTHLALVLGLGPNAVTTLALLAGVAAGWGFAAGHWVLAAFLLQLHHFLDGADGNLARLLKRCTPFGAAYDRVSDQLVRAAVFVGVAVGAGVPLWAKATFLATLYWDLLIVHAYILPRIKARPPVRARWKQWFLERGIIPGFDHFTIFFLISLGGLFGNLAPVVYAVVVLKNLDWIYRVYECRREDAGSAYG